MVSEAFGISAVEVDCLFPWKSINGLSGSVSMIQVGQVSYVILRIPITNLILLSSGPFAPHYHKNSLEEFLLMFIDCCSWNSSFFLQQIFLHIYE